MGVEIGDVVRLRVSGGERNALVFYRHSDVCVNVVYVDEKAVDSYGHARCERTSVPHQSVAAPGSDCFVLPGAEVDRKSVV